MTTYYKMDLQLSDNFFLKQLSRPLKLTEPIVAVNTEGQPTQCTKIALKKKKLKIKKLKIS
jgi:hypothetical protein